MIQDLHTYYGSKHKLIPLLYDFIVEQYRDDLTTFNSIDKDNDILKNKLENINKDFMDYFIKCSLLF